MKITATGITNALGVTDPDGGFVRLHIVTPVSDNYVQLPTEEAMALASKITELVFHSLLRATEYEHG